MSQSSLPLWGKERGRENSCILHSWALGIRWVHAVAWWLKLSFRLCQPDRAAATMQVWWILSSRRKGQLRRCVGSTRRSTPLWGILLCLLLMADPVSRDMRWLNPLFLSLRKIIVLTSLTNLWGFDFAIAFQMLLLLFTVYCVAKLSWKPENAWKCVQNVRT